MPGRLARDCERFVATAPLQSVAGDPTGGYRAVGARGRLLVVLPGLVGPADSVASLAHALGAGWRVCAVTYPRADSIEALVAWLEGLRRREGGGLASLYGGSFGGLVGQAWLRAHPAAIGDVVLSGTGPPDPARAAKNARAIRWMRRLPMPAWRGLLRLAVFLSTGRAEDRRYWRRYYGAEIGALTWADVESRYRVSIGIDRDGPIDTAALAAWRGRMLVVAGSRDRLARPAMREALLAAYPRAEFHAFQGAGHAPALEQPEEWLRVVASFLRGT